MSTYASGAQRIRRSGRQSGENGLVGAHGASAYAAFPPSALGSWLDTLQNKIHTGLANPAPALRSRSPSPLRAVTPDDVRDALASPAGTGGAAPLEADGGRGSDAEAVASDPEGLFEDEEERGDDGSFVEEVQSHNEGAHAPNSRCMQG